MRSRLDTTESGEQTDRRTPWRKSVVKSVGQGQSCHVMSSHQTVSDHTLRQRFPHTQQSRSLAACSRLEKLVMPSIFDRNLSFSIM